MNPRAFREPGFNLAYLGLAVQRGVKPLGRWEDYRGPSDERFLHRLGLHTRLVSRRVRRPGAVVELVFSRGRAEADAYASCFDGTPIRHTPDEVRTEGRLFGYPNCCVESFVAFGYRPNGLPPRDQELLFHWACPGCRETPALASGYRAVYRECRGRFRSRGLFGPASTPTGRRVPAVERAAAAITLTSTLIGVAALTHGVWALPPAGEPAPPSETEPGPLNLDHLLPVADDADNDGLTTDEEFYFGTDAARTDTHGAGTPDGYPIAQRLALQVNNLSREVTTDQPYAMDHYTKGTHACAVCGAMVNMGFVAVTNPRLETGIAVPFLALHFMENGSFAFQTGDDPTSQRLDPMLLDVVINGHPGSKIRAEGDNIVLHWYGVGGKQYRILSASALAGDWAPSPILDGAGTMLDYVRPTSAGPTQEFFAVESIPAP